MKKTILLFAAALFVTGVRAADDLTLKSPDGTVKVSVELGERMTYTVSIDGNTVLTDCEMAMNMGGR